MWEHLRFPGGEGIYSRNEESYARVTGILSLSYGHLKTASAERSMMIPLRDTMVDGESVLSFFRRRQHDCVGGGVAQGALSSGLFKITRSKTATIASFQARESYLLSRWGSASLVTQRGLDIS
jgi:hypothetical protein